MKRILTIIFFLSSAAPNASRFAHAQDRSPTNSCNVERNISAETVSKTLDAAENEADDADRKIVGQNWSEAKQVGPDRKVILDRTVSEGPLPSTVKRKKKDRRKWTLERAFTSDQAYRKKHNRTTKAQRKDGLSLFATAFLSNEFSTTNPKSKKARQLKREAYKEAVAYLSHEIRTLRSDTEAMKTIEGRERLKALRSMYGTMKWRLSKKKYWIRLGNWADEYEEDDEPDLDTLDDSSAPTLASDCVDDPNEAAPEPEPFDPSNISQCLRTISPAEIQPSLYDLGRSTQDVFSKLAPIEPEKRYTHGLEWTNSKSALFTSIGGSFGGVGDPLVRVFASADFYERGDVNINAYDLDPVTGEKIPGSKSKEFIIHPDLFSWEHQRYLGHTSTPRIGDYVLNGNVMGGLAHNGSPLLGGNLYVSHGILPNTLAVGGKADETHWVPLTLDMGIQGEHQFWGVQNSGIPNYFGTHFGVGSRLQMGDNGFVSLNGGYALHTETASGPGYYAKMRGAGYMGANAFFMDANGKPEFSFDASLYQDPLSDDRLQNGLFLLNVKRYTDIGAFGVQYRHTQQRGVDTETGLNLNPQSRDYLGLTYQYVFTH